VTVSREAVDLRAEHLTVRFGGAVAIDDLSLCAPSGQVTGLIGPNGAGKTTTFNACSGLLRPDKGRILLAGRDVSEDPPQKRARAGLGRTYQRMQLCESMTVIANVALGPEARLSGRAPWRHLFSPSDQQRAIATATDEALELCGIGDLRDRTISTLSTGKRRLVELARVLAGGFSVLLLDEPSSGLDEAETEAFGEILRRVQLERRVGMLLVEHDMSLVMSICARLYVLDFGKLIFEGLPDEAQASEVVRAAYLGAPA